MSSDNEIPGPTKALSDKSHLETESSVSDDDECNSEIMLATLSDEADAEDITLLPSPFPVPHSKAEETWERIKRTYDVGSRGLDSIMQMLGLEEAKLRLVEIAFRITLANATKGVIPLPDELTIMFQGNPGIGKKTIANHYVQFLLDFKVCRAPRGPPIPRFGQGPRSNRTSSPSSSDTYDYYHGIEKGQGSVLVFVCRSNQDLQDITKDKKRRDSIPRQTIHLQDFTEYELYHLFVKELSKKFNGTVTFEGFAINGVPTKVLVNRMAKNRGTHGFGNACLIENVILGIIKRQYIRLLEESETCGNVETRVLTQEDLLGRPPSQTLEHHEAWKKLEAMVGLKSVKTAVKSLILQLQWNYNRELAELPPVKTSLNRIFLGNPGTGKTTVARLYAKIFADAGFLSSSEIVVKTPADFIGSYLGESETRTKKILQEARGKVLVIDEAYMLGNSGHREEVDTYRAGVIDTLVGEVQGADNEDRCVLLLGYREQMQEMFRNTNPGLARRFPVSSAFEFEDYTKEELREILELKLAEEGLKATDDAKQVAMDVLERARNSAVFANAGEIEILLTQAKERQHARLADLGCPSEESLQTLEPSDMDENFDRIDRAGVNIKNLFGGMVGSQSLVEKLESYQKIVRNAKAIDLGDPKDFIPFNFIFRGPPGTGKSTTARKMGKVFYDLGFLATTEIIECSVSDLIGQYVGQTGPQTRKVFEEALGKVLFIDEAYRLVSGYKSSYASEAVGEIVDILTQEKFHNKLVVILAGYEWDMNKLLATNPGLNSRFPETIDFKNLTPRECHGLLFDSIKPRLVFELLQMAQWEKIDQLFAELASLPFWGNARDVQTLAKNVMSTVLIEGTIKEDIVSREIEKMLVERRKRARQQKQSKLGASY
ncbi:ATPases of the AAA+ class [Annulohypoxylon truncatum]|uniref:ATPases of the AAA+ class n=1 Tax=Annulohypoxylon truncatum TaxID=327061 RepID=UPI00200802CE|nr:ATPases of the AAA+ class [Annulohypoxylon truncatum]KAI1204096.1 ATPases of the AAA+ class [Annulohypoxylon truncatum]